MPQDKEVFDFSDIVEETPSNGTVEEFDFSDIIEEQPLKKKEQPEVSPSQDGSQDLQDTQESVSSEPTRDAPLEGLGGQPSNVPISIEEPLQAARIFPQESPESPIPKYEKAQSQLAELTSLANNAKPRMHSSGVTLKDKGEYDRLQSQIKSVRESVSEMQSEIDKAISGMLSEIDNNLDAFITKDISGLPIADTEKSAEFARKKVAELGLPEDGYAWKYIWNKAKDHAAFKIVEPEVNKEFAKSYEKMFGKPLEEDRKDIAERIGGVSERAAKADAEIDIFAKQQLEEANKFAEEDLIARLGGVQPDQYVQQAQSTYEQSVAMVNQTFAGKVTPEGFAGNEAEYGIYKAQLEQAERQYNESVGKFNESAIAAEYGANRRYQRNIEEYADGVYRGLNQEIEQKLKPADQFIQNRIKDAYKDAYGKVAENNEWLKTSLDRNIGSYLTRPLQSAVGGSLKAIGTISGSEDMQVYGDYIQDRYNIGSAEIEEWSDWFTDYRKALRSTGQLMGSMSTSMIPAVAVGLVTGGLGAAPTYAALAGGSVAFLGETTDLTGRMYDQTFAETGDAGLATERAKKVFDSQMYLAPTYGLEMLPFVGKFSGGAVKRFFKGAAMEYATETLLQEYPQNAIEKAIMDDAELSEVYKYMSFEDLNNTAKNTVSVALMGGGGQVNQYFSEKQKAQENLEKNIKSLAAHAALGKVTESQAQETILNIVANHGVQTADAVIAAAFNGNEITYEQASVLLSDVKAAEEYVKGASELGLSDKGAYVFTNLRMKLREAERQADNEKDPAMKSIKAKRASKLKRDMEDMFNGGETRYATLTFPNGTFQILTYDEARKKMKEDGFGQTFVDGELKFEAFGNEAQALQEELKASVESDLSRNDDPKETPISMEDRAKERDEYLKKREVMGIEPEILSEPSFTIGSTITRVENGTPTSLNAIDNASNWLYSQYKKIAAMKSDPNRPISLDRVNDYLDAIGKDIEMLESAKQKMQEDSEKTPTQTETVQETPVKQPVSESETNKEDTQTAPVKTESTPVPKETLTTEKTKEPTVAKKETVKQQKPQEDAKEQVEKVQEQPKQEKPKDVKTQKEKEVDVPFNDSFKDVKEEDLVKTETIFKKKVDNSSPYDGMNQEARDRMSSENEMISSYESVDINEIIPTQEFVNGKNLKRKSLKKPIIAKWKGNYHVLDGHHRIASDIVDGKKEIDATVIDFDKSPQEKIDIPKTESRIKELLAERDRRVEEMEDYTDIDAEIDQLVKSLPKEEIQREFTEEERAKAESDRLAEEKELSKDEMTPEDWIRENITLSKKDVQDHADLKAWEENKSLYKNIVNWDDNKESLAFQLEALSDESGQEITIDQVINWANSVAQERNTTGTTKKAIPAMKARKKSKPKTKRKVTADALRKAAEKLRGEKPKGGTLSADPFLLRPIVSAAIESAAKLMDAGALILESDIVDHIVEFIRNNPQFKNLSASQRKALNLRKYVIDQVGFTEEDYLKTKIQSLKKEAQKEKREAIKEVKKDVLSNVKQGFSEFLSSMKRKDKMTAKEINSAKSEMRKLIRESKADLSAAQTSKILGIVSGVNTKNIEQKTTDVVEYIESVQAKTLEKEQKKAEKEEAKKQKEAEKKEEFEKKSLEGSIRSKMNPKNYLIGSKRTGKRKKTRITLEAKDAIESLQNSFGSSLKEMNLEELSALSKLLDTIIQTGKAQQAQAQALRKAHRDNVRKKTIEYVSRRTEDIKPLEGGKKEAIKQLSRPVGTKGGGNVVIIDGMVLTPIKEDLKLALGLDESMFDNAEVVTVPSSAGLSFDTEKLTRKERIKGRFSRAKAFMYSRTDLRTMLQALMTDKDSQQWFESNIIDKLGEANERTFSDRKMLVNQYNKLKSDSFKTEKAANKFLNAKSGLELKGTDEKSIISNLTNDEAAYYYNVLKDYTSIDKALEAKFSKEDILNIVKYVNTNQNLKSYADGMVDIYSSYLSKVNATLETAGYDAVKEKRTDGEKGLKVSLLENTGKAAEEKLDVLNAELQQLEMSLDNATDEGDLISMPKKIEKKKIQIAEFKNKSEQEQFKRDIYEEMYGSIENIPNVVPYSPRSVQQTDVSNQGADELWSDSDKKFKPSVISDNLIERKTGGSLGLSTAEGMFLRYVESMTNTVNKMDAYENIFAMFADGSPSMKLIEKEYGKQYVTNLREVLANSILERNTQSMNRVANSAYAWIIRSAATTMFLNTRSAALQVISMPNFFVDAVADYGLGMEYMKGLSKPFSKEMKQSVSEIIESGEFSNRLESSNDPDIRDLRESRDGSKMREYLDKAYNFGYYPTKFVDSKIAIVFAGAPLYSALKNKYYEEYSKEMSSEKAMEKAKDKAMTDFWKTTNESQQSALQMYRSTEQNNPWTRLFLTFGSVSVLYSRKMIRAASDIKNGRISAARGMSKILYYGAVQNLMFLPLQQGIMWATSGILPMMMGGGDDKDKEESLKQSYNILNQSLNATLKGLGIYGVLAATLKDIGIEAFLQFAPKSEHEEIKKAYDYIVTGTPKKEKASQVILNAIPTLSIKLKNVDRALRERKEGRTPLEERWNNAVPYISSVDALGNIPTNRLVKLGDAMFDIANEDLSNIESVGRLTELLTRYDMDKRKPETTEESLKESRKETTQKIESLKEAKLEELQKDYEGKYMTSKDKIRIPMELKEGIYKEMNDVLKEAGRNATTREKLRKELAEMHNAKVFNEKEPKLASIFVTKEGEGTSFGTDYELMAAEYKDAFLKKEDELKMKDEDVTKLRDALQFITSSEQKDYVAKVNKKLETLNK